MPPSLSRWNVKCRGEGSGSVGRAPRLPTAAAIAAQRRITLLSEDRAILIRAELIFAGSGFGALAAVGIRFEDSQCDSLSETTDGFVRLCGTPH